MCVCVGWGGGGGGGGGLKQLQFPEGQFELQTCRLKHMVVSFNTVGTKIPTQNVDTLFCPR